MASRDGPDKKKSRQYIRLYHFYCRGRSKKNARALVLLAMREADRTATVPRPLRAANA